MRFKAWLESEKKPMLPSLIAKYHNDVSQEIHKFKENLIKLDKLSENVKRDSLFEEIDHIFNSKLKILYNELLFCKFENLSNAEYFNKIYKRFMSVYQDMKSLNTDFSDYMYALTNTEYENTKQDLEIIRIRVEAMSEVAEQYVDESCKS